MTYSADKNIRREIDHIARDAGIPASAVIDVCVRNYIMLEGNVPGAFEEDALAGQFARAQSAAEVLGISPEAFTDRCVKISKRIAADQGTDPATTLRIVSAAALLLTNDTK
jgi:23S rRNA maturation mini-RNase III